ncbi:hypothetical protein ACJX0J_012773 [Zea mays]
MEPSASLIRLRKNSTQTFVVVAFINNKYNINENMLNLEKLEMEPRDSNVKNSGVKSYHTNKLLMHEISLMIQNVKKCLNYKVFHSQHKKYIFSFFFFLGFVINLCLIFVIRFCSWLAGLGLFKVLGIYTKFALQACLALQICCVLKHVLANLQI